MNVAIIGAGKLGAPLAAVLAANKEHVTVCDVDERTVELLNQGKAPVDETGLDELIELAHPWLRATTDINQAVSDTDIALVVVPTPSDSTGRFSNRYVLEAVEQIGTALARRTDEPDFFTVVVVSTVMPGSIRGPITEAFEATSGRTRGIDCSVVFNPAFIALGSVIHDFTHPDVVLIGADDEIGPRYLRRLLVKVIANEPAWHNLSSVDAEIAKLSLNCSVVAKIALANTIGEFCENISGADARAVTRAVGSDSRIGTRYFQVGGGAGGPCVPTGTLIQSEFGLRPIETLNAGDRVFAHDGRLHLVVEVMQRHFDGELVELTVAGFAEQPIRVTPEHPVWGTYRYEDDRPYWRTTPMRGRPARRLTVPTRQVFPPEFLAAKTYQQGDYISLAVPQPDQMTPGTVDLVRSNGPDRSIAMTPDFFRLVGYYLAEGSTWRKMIKFSFHAEEVDLAEDVISLCADLLDRKADWRTTHGMSARVRLADTGFAAWLKTTLGHNAATKCPPMEWLGLPDEHLSQLLRGMWYGDGSRSCGVFAWASVSHQMWNFMKLALLRLGIAFTCHVADARISRDGVTHQRAYFLRVRNPEQFALMNELVPRLRIEERPSRRRTTWIQDGRLVTTLKRCSGVPYSGPVWNLEVDDAHSYALEAGVVHNCFPRDLVAFVAAAEELGVDVPLMKSVREVNNHQALRIAAKVVEDKRVGILGLTYKPNTSVTEASLGTKLSEILADWDVAVETYDPVAGGTMSSADELVAWAETVIVATAWSEFAGVDYGDKRVIDVWSALPQEENIERVGTG